MGGSRHAPDAGSVDLCPRRDRNPIVFQNSNEDYWIRVYDLFWGGKPRENINIQFGFESFHFDRAYQEKLPSAAIEEKFTADLNWVQSIFTYGLQGVWIGSRNLSHYGYGQHFKRYDLDVQSPDFGRVSERKNQKAPSFWIWNTSLVTELRPHLALTARINNVLDFTQTRWGDSPTSWHYHVNHAHFDNLHTWGPLQGREFAVGLETRW